MPSTVLDIIDSAVKIGLGAAISGVATYLLTRQQNIHAINQKTELRKTSKIEEAADLLEQFNEYSHACSIKVASVAKKHSDTEDLHSAASDLSKGLSKITKAATNVRLIGESEIASSLNELQALVVRLVNFMNNSGSKSAELLDVTEFNQLIDQVSSQKQKILNELSEAFMRV